MATPMRWRPLAAFDLDHARTLIEQSIAQWREDWFGARGSDAVCVEAVRLVSADTPHDLARAVWVSEIGWTAARQAPRLLAALALDVPVASVMHDAASFAMLGERVVDELASALATVGVSGPETPPPHEGVLVRLVAACGTELGSIFCPASLICERCVPRSNDATPRSAASSRRQALASTEVALEAHLGRASLTLDQLLGLAIGDVLTLDRKRDDLVDLIVLPTQSTAAKPVASGRLGRSAGQFSIQLDSLAAQEHA